MVRRSLAPNRRSDTRERILESATILFGTRGFDSVSLDQIAAEYGQHVTAELSVKMSPSDGAAVVEELRANPPVMIGGRQVVGIEDFPEANLLRLWLDEVGGRGVRLQIRPSGTEPKVKLYGEAVDMATGELQQLLAALTP